MGSRRWVGAAILLLVFALAWLAPLASGHGAIEQRLDNSLASPSARHWLGTDVFGRDHATRLAHALRLSLSSAVVVVVLAAGLGSALAIVALRVRGLDRLLTMAADATAALPALLLVLLIVAFAPGEVLTLYLALVAAMWVEYFRVVRLAAAAILASKHVEAARLAGLSHWAIARWHVLPELAPLLATLMSYGAVAVVLAISALSFVSVGVRPPTPELGQMLVELLPYYQEAPWLIGSAVVVLFVFLTGLVMLTGARTPDVGRTQ